MSDRTPRTTVIVGAGSSGGVLASRLSENPDEHVILVEAGPDFGEAKDLPEVLADADIPSLREHDWGQQSDFIEQPGVHEVQTYPRGKLVGGSSAVNAAIAVRGFPRDYDDWAALGNDEWSWDSVLPFFVKLENDQDFGDYPYHGQSGPIAIRRDEKADWPDIVQAFAKEFASRGYEEFDDANAPGTAGVGPLPRNKIGRYRASSAVTYVQQAKGRPNFEVVPNALVTRVVIHDGRAVGVEVSEGGRPRTISADRIVLSAGAINTPQILMLSGIGPKAVIEDAGLEVIVDLPGVGQNLQDHFGVPLVFSTADASESRFGFRVLLAYSSGEPGAEENDMFSVPALLPTSSLNFPTSPDVSAAVMIAPAIGKPRGTGWVSISSADPEVRAEVHLNFLSDEMDMARLIRSVHLFLDLSASDTVAPHIGTQLVGPSAETQGDDAQLRQWILENVVTGYHPAGTCRMGPDGDGDAVVDQRLKVRGVEGLFIADASVMPVIPTGFTNLPCYMIGERLAEWLQQE